MTESRQRILIKDEVEEIVFKDGVAWGRFTSRMNQPDSAEEARQAMLRLINYLDGRLYSRGDVPAHWVRYALLEEE